MYTLKFYTELINNLKIKVYIFRKNLMTSFKNDSIRTLLEKCDDGENINFKNVENSKFSILKDIIDICNKNDIFEDYVDSYYKKKAFLANIIEFVYLLNSIKKFNFVPFKAIAGSYNVILIGKLETNTVALRILYNSSYTQDEERIYYADEYAENLKKVSEVDTSCEYILSPIISATDVERITFNYNDDFEPTCWNVLPICKNITEKVKNKRNIYNIDTTSKISSTKYLNNEILDGYFKTVMYSSDIIHHSGIYYRDWKLSNCMIKNAKVVLTDVDFETSTMPISTIRSYTLGANLKKYLLLSMFKDFPTECKNILKENIDYNEEITFSRVSELLPNFELNRSLQDINDVNRRTAILMDNIIAFYSWLITAIHYTHAKAIDYYHLEYRSKINTVEEVDQNCKELIGFINTIGRKNFYSGINVYEKISDYIHNEYDGCFNLFVEHKFKNLVC